MKSAAGAAAPNHTAAPLLKAAATASKISAEPARPTTASSTKTSFAALLIAIRDRSAEKAREAALAMGACGDPAAVDVLVEVVRNEDRYFHTTVRVAAVKSLGQFADARGIDAIVEATRDTMAEVSEAAIHALAATKDQQALAPLLRIVKNTDNFFLPTVRRAAILALKSLGGPQATAELKAVAANPAEDPSIRAAAQ